MLILGVRALERFHYYYKFCICGPPILILLNCQQGESLSFLHPWCLARRQRKGIGGGGGGLVGPRADRYRAVYTERRIYSNRWKAETHAETQT